MKKLVLAISAALLVGCAATSGKVDPNYQAQLESLERQRTAQMAVQMASTQSSAASASVCERDSNPGLCIAMLSLTQVMATMNGGNNQQIQVPTHQTRHHPAWGILGNVLDKGLAIGLPAYYGHKNHQITSNMWGGIVGSITSQGPTYSVNGNMSMGDMATVGGNLGDTDNSIAVGGNFGDTDNSISAGGDQIIGDGNTNVGGDQWNGNDQYNGDNNNNSGRFGSPGPFDSSGDNRDNDNSGDNRGLPCTGEDC